MLKGKLILLLCFTYMANAQYRRLPPRPLPDRPVIEQTPSYTNVIEIKPTPPTPSRGPTLRPARFQPNRGRPNRPLPPKLDIPIILNTENNNPDSLLPTREPVSELIITPELGSRLNSKPNPADQTETESGRESERESEIKRNPESELKPEDNAEAQPAPETELEPSAELELDVEPKNSLEVDPKPEAEITEAERDAETDQKPDKESEAEPTPEPEDESESEPDSKFDPKPDSEAEPEPDSGAEPESDSEADPEPDSEADPEPDSKSEPEPDSEADPEPDSEADPEPDSKSEPEPDSEAEPEPGSESEPEPDSKSEPEPGSESEPEPDSKSEPDSSEPESELQDPSSTTIRPADIICDVKNGYYVFPTACDIFIECRDFIAKKKICPDGLLFNPKADWPKYPCSFPSEVECRNYTITSPSTPIGNCPRRFGTFTSNSGDCGKYIVCDDGRATVMSCPMGLAFNPKIGGCDWPENVLNCNPKVFKNFICPVPSIDSKGKFSEKVYNYRYKNSCKEYVACMKGQPRLLRCDAGLSFDDITSRCIDSDKVKNCKMIIDIVDTKLKI